MPGDSVCLFDTTEILYFDLMCQDQSEFTSQDMGFPFSKTKQNPSVKYGLNTERRLITGHQAKWQLAFSMQREPKVPKAPTKDDRNYRALVPPAQ